MKSPVLSIGGRTLEWGTRTLIMGILNITPDSFSGDGLFEEPHQRADEVTWLQRALEQARRFVREGADILDVGGESTRPGSHPVSVEEEIRRVVPVVRLLADELDALISVDTYKAAVAEAAVQAGEAKYRSILETTTEWIWEMDLSGKHTYSNQAVEKILGYSSCDILGGNCMHLIHEDDRRSIERRLPELIALKQGWRGWVIRWRHKDGSYRTLESNAHPIINAGGELTG